MRPVRGSSRQPGRSRTAFSASRTSEPRFGDTKAAFGDTDRLVRDTKAAFGDTDRSVQDTKVASGDTEGPFGDIRTATSEENSPVAWGRTVSAQDPAYPIPPLAPGRLGEPLIPSNHGKE